MKKNEDEFMGKKYWDQKEKERREYMKEIENSTKETFSEKQKLEILKLFKK